MLASGLNKVFYWRICRAYAHHFVGDKPADAMLRVLCSYQFYRVHGFWPNFVQPVRFSEKVWSRMLHDRDPLLTLVNDKLRVRDYVASKGLRDFLIPMLWTGKMAEYIPFQDLPSRFVIKANHGCGYNLFVRDKQRLDIEETRGRIRRWLGANFGRDTYLGIAWGYKGIKPSIIIEPLLEEKGKVPVDYKFYCFSGRVEVVTIHYDRFIQHKTRAFDREFVPRDFRYDFEQWIGECERPPEFEVMIEIAEKLSEKFAFMRVDLYSVRDKVYFSELTPYPGGVSTKFLPAHEDRILGERWKER